MSAGKLHQRAVAMIYDWLTDGRSLLLRTKGENRSNGDYQWRPRRDLMNGVAHIRIPDDQNDLLPSGGVRTADLQLLNAELNLVRTIEVEVTSPVPAHVRDNLIRRGVDVVEVPVRDEDDLLHGVFRSGKEFQPQFSSPEGKVIRESTIWATESDREYGRRVQSLVEASNNMVSNLINAIEVCDPELRRRLSIVLNQLDTLESIYPIADDNPVLKTRKQ